MTSGPLAGYVIVDLTTMVMGPLATQILGDMGATVIKVERLDGDPQRYPLPSRNPTMNGVFLNLNRNKQSIAVDLKKQEGQQMVLRLCRQADAVVTSLRRGSARKLGLDYNSIRKVKPDIVYCVANGFGEKGKYRDKAAYDDVIQAASGIAGLLEAKTGEAQYMPTALCDKVSGMTMVYAILGALLHRERSGEGQEVETPMFEASVAFNLIEHICGHVFEPPLGEFGWSRILSAYRKPFPTSDGFACIMPYSDANWRDFFAEIERPELTGEQRFSTHPLRIQNIDELYALIKEHSPSRSTAEWMEFCDAVNIPAMPVIHPADLWNDEHIRATGLLDIAEHPSEGTYRTIGSPVNFSRTPTSIRVHAPNLGENTVEVARMAGMEETEISSLIDAGVLRVFEPTETRRAGKAHV